MPSQDTPFARSNAKWIWPAGSVDEVNQYVEFRQEFDVSEAPGNANLFISVDGDYVAWVNGELAGFGQYHDYPDDKVYDSLDVTSLLRPGRNVLCILAWRQGESTFQYIKGRTGLIFALEMGDRVIASGRETRYRRSLSGVEMTGGDEAVGFDSAQPAVGSGFDSAQPAYLGGPMPKVTGQLGFTFEYDARRDDGWRVSDYAMGREWKSNSPSDQREAGDPPARPRPIKKLGLLDRVQAKIVSQGTFIRSVVEAKAVAEEMQSAYMSFLPAHQVFGIETPVMPASEPLVLAPQDVPDDKGGVYLMVDLGREETGILDMDIEAEAGTVIDVAWGEHLHDLRVRASVGGRNFAGRYVCKQGRQQFTGYLRRFGCRYLQFHIIAPGDTFAIHYLGLRPTEYPLEFAGEFESDDALQKMIYKTSRRTLQLCMHEHYEDCPWREQALYANDSRNQALAGYYGFGEYQFPAAAFKLLGDGLKDDGYLELCAPAEIPITIPSFSLAWIIESAEHYLYSGDTEAAKLAYQRAKKMMDVYIGSMTNGLMPCPKGKRYWQFYDWADGLDGVGAGEDWSENVQDERYESPLALFFSLALKAAAELAKAAGCEADVERYESAREAIRQSFHSAFWDSGEQAYVTRIGPGTQKHFAELPQALAVLAGVCPDGVAEGLRGKLVDSNSDLVETTLSQAIYKFDALLQDPEKYAPWVFGKIAKDWGHMLRNGATTFWETIKGGDDFGKAGSLCHGWSGTPVYFYAAYLLGIKPLEPGFRAFTVTPVTDVVPRASGNVPTPYGMIEVKWEMCGDRLELNVKHPPEIRRVQ